MADVSVPVGKTKDAGWEIGVSKTLGFGVDEVWSVLVGEPGVWLGDGALVPTVKGEQWQADDGTVGELRSRREHDRIRLTWRRVDWREDSIVQVALKATSPQKTVVRFHQERMVDGSLREQQRKHWQAAMERLELAVANSVQTGVR
ncbi:SRPBCC domain-containing protein [Antrihabitans spumae]|uniref:SRPBCC domain-containing protein n=1 Tax=Antrihabitans spumae TaxID=3373370 RepID=A0ABW7KQ99_9NOCA